MRIVDHKTFLSMPEGTVFAKYQPQVFGDIRVKGQSLHTAGDFYYWPLWEPGGDDEVCDILTDAEKSGAEVAIDTHCEQRDGLFECFQLFAVFSKDDVRAMVESLFSVSGAEMPRTMLSHEERQAIEHFSFFGGGVNTDTTRYASVLRSLLARTKREGADERLAKYLAMEAAFRDFAEKYQEIHKCLPVVLHFEGYKYMGNIVEIISANVFDPPRGAEVVVGDRIGNCAKTELSELSLR